MESGFVVWLDPDGGKNKVFGIRFPIGLKRMGMSIEQKDKRDMSRDWRDQEDKSGLIDREKEKFRDKDFNKRLETLEGLQERLEIVEGVSNLKNKGKRLRLPPKESGKEDSMEKKIGQAGDFSKGGPMELSLDEARKLGIEARVGRENEYFVYELKVPLVKSVKYPHAIGIKPDRPIGLGLEIPMFNADLTGARDERMPVGMGSGMYPKENFQLWATVTLSLEHPPSN
jgi:hypothetical protein